MPYRHGCQPPPSDRSRVGAPVATRDRDGDREYGEHDATMTLVSAAVRVTPR